MPASHSFYEILVSLSRIERAEVLFAFSCNYPVGAPQRAMEHGLDYLNVFSAAQTPKYCRDSHLIPVGNRFFNDAERTAHAQGQNTNAFID